MFLGGEDLSFSDAAFISARCLAISFWKVKMLETTVDPSERGDEVVDAVALRAASACRRFTLRRAASVLPFFDKSSYSVYKFFGLSVSQLSRYYLIQNIVHIFVN